MKSFPIFVIFLFIIQFLPSFSYSQTTSPQVKAAMEMQSFYKHPSPELLADIIKIIDSEEDFLSKSSSVFPYIGFITVALSKYQDKSEDFYDLSNKLKYSQELIKQCLKLSQIKDTVINWRGHDPSINDLVWSGFFASGDTRYLDRLVSELKYCGRKDSLVLFLTGITAKWSLCSNAKSYPIVKEYLEQTLENRPTDLKVHINELLISMPGEIKEQMKEGIIEIKKREKDKKADPLCSLRDYNKDGLQIHYALIKDKNFFEEWKKPEMPTITSADTYKKGEDVIPIIIFATDGKDTNENADLTYDITITKPDGSQYGHFEQLEVWKDEPAPAMHLVKQPILLHIEKTDPAGVYQINSVVYENNKKVKVTFELSFQVID